MARVMTVAEARVEHGSLDAYAQLAEELRFVAYSPARWHSHQLAPPAAGFYLRRTRAGWITRDWWDPEMVCWRRTQRGVICANQSWPWAAM
jgi:hypothetical protein